MDFCGCPQPPADLAEQFRPLGAKIAESPGEAASAVEVLITMLADDGAVDAIVFSPGAVLSTLPEAGVHVSMSTISVELSRRLAAAHRQKRQHYVAAPVFGRPDSAAASKLFIAAGEAEQIQRCHPIFDATGQRTFSVGKDAPAANVIKLAGNFLITSVIESLAESFALVQKSGVDPNGFLEVLTESLFASPVYRSYGKMIAARKFEPVGFRLPLGLKDNSLLISAAEEVQVPMPLASLVHDRFVSALARGLGEADWAAIAGLSYKDAGI